MQINNWAFQWKISFNPDPTQQVREIVFSGKRKKPIILYYVLITSIVSYISFNSTSETSCYIF